MGGTARGMLGFQAFPSLQGLKTKPPNMKGLVGLTDCYQSFLLVLSLCACVCVKPPRVTVGKQTWPLHPSCWGESMGLSVQAPGASHG